MHADAQFEILGAAVGSTVFASAEARRRARKAQPLLDAIAYLPDPQEALRLLRNCASFGKLIFAARVVPFGMCNNVFDEFDTSVRRCFEGFSGIHPTDAPCSSAHHARRTWFTQCPCPRRRRLGRIPISHARTL